jgi:PAS domain S-box-containing protein
MKIKHIGILFGMFTACALFYYAGEINDYFRLGVSHYWIFYTVHDLHRVFFLLPILYASYLFRLKGAVVANLLTFLLLMPRALFFSTFPDPVLRAILFSASALIISYLTVQILGKRDEERNLLERLRVSDEKYRLMADNIEEVFWVATPKIDRMIYVSLAYEKIWGRSCESLYADPQSFMEAVHPEDKVALVNALEECLMKGTRWSFVYRIIRPDGSICWIEDSGFPVYDEQGNHYLNTGVAKDITDRKLADAELTATNELLDMFNITQTKRELICQTTSYLKKYLGCEAVGMRLQEGDDFPYYETVGFPEEFVEAERYLCSYSANGEVRRDSTGNPVLECMCGNILCGRFDPSKPFFTDHGSFWSNCTSELLASTTEADRQARTRNRCNGEGYESVGLFPFRYSGKTFGLLQVNDRRKGLFTPRIISFLERFGDNLAIALAQHCAEENLRESEKKHRTILQTAMDGFCLIDLKGLIMDTNQAYCEMTGYSRQELLNMTLSDFEVIESADDTAEHMRKVVGRGFDRFDTRHRRKDGKIFDVEVSVQYQENRGGYFVVFLRDITEGKRKEAELREGTLRLETVIRAGNVGLWDWNLLTNEVFYSPEWKRQIGYDDHEISNKFDEWQAHVHPDDLDRVIGIVRNYIEKPWPNYNIEFRFRHKDGSYRWILAQASLIYNEQGKPVRMMGSHVDITESKQAEKALHDSYLQYQQLTEQAIDGIFILDNTGKFLFVNSSFCQMLGYTREEMLKLSILDFHPEGQKDIGRQRIAKVLAGELQHFERSMKRKDGSEFWIEVSAKVLDNGTIQNIVRDITERRSIDEAKKEQLFFLQQLIDSIPNPVFYKDTAGVYTGLNKAFESYLGKNREQIIGKTVYDISPQDLADKYKEMDEELFRDPGFQVYESRVLQADGTMRDVIFNKAPFYDKNNKLAGLVGIILDVTDIRRAEEEHRQLEARLSRSEKMEALGTLAGGVAHDLNNVLGVVISFAELLSEKVDDASPLRSYTKHIIDNSNRAAAIVDDLLTMARRGVQTEKVFSLNVTVTEYQKSPEYQKLLTIHPQVQIETRLDPDLLNIQGSPVHLSKTVMNLVTNSMEAMLQGGCLTITTQNRYLDRPVHGYDELKEGDYVVLTVSDTGEGISEHDVRHIFEPFYTKKTMGKSGTGLGLSVVWGTVKDHSGYIDVESEPGRGATFTLYFPVTRKEAEQPAAAVPVSEYMGNGELILVVDDVYGQRELVTQMLVKLNYQVDAVSSWEEAVEYVKTKKPDLIVLDMIMEPGMDGLQTYSRILAIHPKQKAVIVSGYSETDKVRLAQQLGAGAFVKKPYMAEKLGVAIRQELARK